MSREYGLQRSVRARRDESEEAKTSTSSGGESEDLNTEGDSSDGSEDSSPDSEVSAVEEDEEVSEFALTHRQKAHNISSKLPQPKKTTRRLSETSASAPLQKLNNPWPHLDQGSGNVHSTPAIATTGLHEKTTQLHLRALPNFPN